MSIVILLIIVIALPLLIAAHFWKRELASGGIATWEHEFDFSLSPDFDQVQIHSWAWDNATNRTAELNREIFNSMMLDKKLFYGSQHIYPSLDDEIRDGWAPHIEDDAEDKQQHYHDILFGRHKH